MRVLKNGIRIFTVVYLAVLLGLTVPLIFGYRVYAVLSGSMEPELPVGSVIYVAPQEYESIEVGDVITYKMNNGRTVITHRVIEKNQQEQMFYTKGDANGTPDAKAVPWDEVEGVVKFSAAGLGYLTIFLESTPGKLFLAALLLWLLALEAIMGGIDHLMKGKESVTDERESV